MSARDPYGLIGRVVDRRYEVLSHLADGGMGSIYVAMDKRLDRKIALKVLRPDLAHDRVFVTRFQREAKAAASLTHPNVVGVYDQGTDEENGGIVFLTMELVRGRTLRDVIAEQAPLTARVSVEIMDMVLAALGAAHEAGIIHRDVKPENVLINQRGTAKVADFGLARAVSSASITGDSGSLLGTAAYLAPEQAEHGRADRRTDVYAAGLVLYEMLTGEKAYDGESPVQVAYAHVHEDVPLASDLVPSVPVELETVIAYACSRNPDERPSSAAEFRTQLDQVAARLPDRVLDAEPVTPDGRRANANHPTLAIWAEHTQPIKGMRDSAAERPAPGASEDTEPVPTSSTSSTSGAADPSGTPPASVPAAATPAEQGPAGPAPHPVVPYVASEPAPLPPPTTPPGARPVGKKLRRRKAGSTVATVPTSGGGTGAAGVPQQRRRRWPRRLALLALVLVLVGGSGYATWFFTVGPGGHSAVPQLASLDRQAAEDRLRRAHLTAEPVTEEFSEDVPKGEVIRAQPSSGSLRHGSAVALVVSKGPERASVPLLAGRDMDQATSDLQQARLAKGTVQEAFDEEVEAGKVIRSDPPAGARLKPQTTVDLVVSKGREPIEVPDLTGKTKAEAEEVLKGKGIRLTQADQEYSDSVEQGRIVRQDPSDGIIHTGDEIRITTSSGPAPAQVPAVTSLTKDDAETAISDAGLQMEVLREEWSDTVPAGSIISQSPTSGSLLRGSKVEVVVSKGPVQVEVPDLFGKSLPEAEALVQQAGLQLQVMSVVGNPNGKVMFQSPGGGDMAPKGSTVRITVV